MKLLSVNLVGQYKGLKDQHFDFTNSYGNIIAFIGLNGSGKSQLMELIAETFAYLEREIRSDFVVRDALSFAVTVRYQIQIHKDETSQVIYEISIGQKGEVIASCNSNITNSFEPCGLKTVAFPDFIVGYSSGLNENLQRAFMKNGLQYFDNMNARMRRAKALGRNIDENQVADINRLFLKRHPNVFSIPEGYSAESHNFLNLAEASTQATRMVYLDYDSTSLVIASLAVLPKNYIKSLLNFPHFRFNNVAKIIIEYDLRNGIYEDETVRDIDWLIRIAGVDNFRPSYRSRDVSQHSDFYLEFKAGKIILDLSNESLWRELAERNYQDPITFFLRLSKIQMLGISNWSTETKKALKKDSFIGTIKKPLKTRMPLKITQIIMADDSGQEIDYDDLSDGESQLLQVMALTCIFNHDRALFLFDEPETHLNPSWRTHFHQHLFDALSTPDSNNQSQIFLSTHSPFLVSSLKKEDVYFFERADEGAISMNSADSQTYGASYEVLTKKFYKLTSLMPQTVIKAIKDNLPSNQNPDKSKAKKWIEENLGESMEKAYLLIRLSE